MTINDLKEKLDNLIENGYGDTEIRIREQSEEFPFSVIKDVDFENGLYYEQGVGLYMKKFLILYSGEYEE